MPSTKIKNVSSSRKSEGQILDLEKGKVNFLFINVFRMQRDNFKINIFKVRNRRKVSSKFSTSPKNVSRSIDAIDNMYFRDKHQWRAPIMRILLEEKYRNVFSRIIQKPCHDRTHPRRYTDERTNRKFSITRVCSRNGAHSRQFQDKY